MPPTSATPVLGTGHGSIHALRVLSYTSDAAEFDSLLSAGGISYGYLPFNDAAQVSRVTADGYKVEAWPTWGITYISLNFASPQVGAIFKQLYVRQAMQRLINQAGYISTFLQGYGNATYGPVPLVPSSQFVSSAEKHNPYPYDPGRRHRPAQRARLEDRAQRHGRVHPARGRRGRMRRRDHLRREAVTSRSSTRPAARESTKRSRPCSHRSRQAGIQLAPSGAPFDTVVGN